MFVEDSNIVINNKGISVENTITNEHTKEKKYYIFKSN